MFNNRMLAVAAVLALTIPALGAAAPIVAPPVPEQLVEGHTVFTVIEVRVNNTTLAANFAAAVAVLVREYDRDAQAVRFPGVLWFNDQYLVNPTSGNARAQDYRYPCGGAVMAVNAGDADPRVIIANSFQSDETRDLVTSYNPITGTGVDYGDNTNPDYSAYPGPDGTPGDDTDDPTYAWANVTLDGPVPTANSDTVVTSLAPDFFGTGVMDYEESYLITDPNDHIWIIDKYLQYTRVGTAGVAQVYADPVWVVNILGSPVFIPDDGIASCGPYNDLASQLYAYSPVRDPALATAAGQADDAAGTAWDPTIGSRFPYRDNPPAGYEEPSDSTTPYCYNGNPDGTPVPCAQDWNNPTQPVRLYNALLYFYLEDLDQPGAEIDHAGADADDTNGCQVGSEWTCPGGDDNNEGNSHPFHPSGGANTQSQAGLPHTDEQVCPPEFQNGATVSNHGGSGVNYPYCGYDHATRNIDLYFSPAGRPFVPLVRDFVEMDLEGQEAAFHYPHAAEQHPTP